MGFSTCARRVLRRHGSTQTGAGFLAGGGKDNRDVPPGTLKAIRDQTGIDELR
jgi:hypothetical protein